MFTSRLRKNDSKKLSEKLSEKFQDDWYTYNQG